MVALVVWITVRLIVLIMCGGLTACPWANASPDYGGDPPGGVQG